MLLQQRPFLFEHQAIKAVKTLSPKIKLMATHARVIGDVRLSILERISSFLRWIKTIRFLVSEMIEPS
jgi:hypothetical protein